jgi:hypothetical protein
MLMSFAIAGPLYYIFNLIWPVEIYPDGYRGVGKEREFMGRTDGFFEDEVIVGVEDGDSTEGHIVVGGEKMV